MLKFLRIVSILVLLIDQRIEPARGDFRQLAKITLLMVQFAIKLQLLHRGVEHTTVVAC